MRYSSEILRTRVSGGLKRDVRFKFIAREREILAGVGWETCNLTHVRVRSGLSGLK